MGLGTAMPNRQTGANPWVKPDGKPPPDARQKFDDGISNINPRLPEWGNRPYREFPAFYHFFNMLRNIGVSWEDT